MLSWTRVPSSASHRLDLHPVRMAAKLIILMMRQATLLAPLEVMQGCSRSCSRGHNEPFMAKRARKKRVGRALVLQDSIFCHHVKIHLLSTLKSSENFTAVPIAYFPRSVTDTSTVEKGKLLIRKLHKVMKSVDDNGIDARHLGPTTGAGGVRFEGQMQPSAQYFVLAIMARVMKILRSAQ